MKKFLPIIFLLSLLLFFPQYTHAASLSGACFPAVKCDANEDYYADDCKKVISTITDCGTAAAGKYYAFSCDNGCYLVTKPQAPECPGGIKIQSTCYTLLNVIDHNGIFKIWDGTALSRLVYMADTACTKDDVPKWDGSKWACGTVAGGGSSLWTASGSDIYNNNSTGKVGIGTSTPTTTLDVKGSVRLEDLQSCNLIKSDSVGVLSCGTLPSSGSSLWTASGSDIYYSSGKVGIGIAKPEGALHIQNSTGKQLMLGHDNQPTSEWYFDVNGSAKMTLNNEKFGSPATIMSFDSAGNVGIGISSSSYPLDVAGSINVSKGTGSSGKLYVDSLETISTDGGSIVWGGGGNNNYFAKEIGIGVKNPAVELDVNGEVRVSSLKNCPSIKSSSYGDLSCGTLPTIPSSIWTSNDYGAYYTAGNVGIGETNPSSPLTVVSNNAINGTALFKDSTTNVNILLDAAVNKDTNIVLKENGTNLWSLGSSYSDDRFRLRAKNWGTEVLTVLQNGSVGIGTAIPAYPLDVAGALNLNKGKSSVGALYVNGVEALWSNGTYFSWGYGGSANYFADKVGIGTSTPSVPLDVEVASGGAATIGSSTNSATGKYAVAIGDNSTASGESSFVAGSSSTASGSSAVALGSVSTASGNSSLALGPGAKATNVNSVALGLLTTSSGMGSIALGSAGVASGDFSFTTGSQTNATGDISGAMGYRMTVTGDQSYAINVSSTPATVSANNVIALLGGKVGIGTPNPNYNLEVYGTAAGSVPWVSLSDQRLKKNVKTIENALDTVEKLRGVQFEWKEDKNNTGKQIGFIAQEVKDVVPEVVTQGSDGYYSMSAGQITAVLTEAVKELKAEIDRLNKRIEELESR